MLEKTNWCCSTTRGRPLMKEGYILMLSMFQYFAYSGLWLQLHLLHITFPCICIFSLAHFDGCTLTNRLTPLMDSPPHGQSHFHEVALAFDLSFTSAWFPLALFTFAYHFHCHSDSDSSALYCILGFHQICTLVHGLVMTDSGFFVHLPIWRSTVEINWGK